MKIHSTFILALILLSTTTSAQSLQGAKQVDFGTIDRTTVRTLTLYNRSQKPIVITSSKVDCNCTRIEYSPRPMMAGDSTTIKITYVPKEMGYRFLGSTTVPRTTNAKSLLDEVLSVTLL